MTKANDEEKLTHPNYRVCGNCKLLGDCGERASRPKAEDFGCSLIQENFEFKGCKHEESPWSTSDEAVAAMNKRIAAMLLPEKERVERLRASGKITDDYREVKYFDGCFISLECGHWVWKGTPEFEEWWSFADLSSPTHNYERGQVAKCVECQREQAVG